LYKEGTDHPLERGGEWDVVEAVLGEIAGNSGFA
jgi:hypothetical protein